MAKWIHNKSEEEKVYQGKAVPASSFWQIPLDMESDFAQSDELIADIVADVVSMSSDGSSDIAGISLQLDFLKGLLLSPRDSDNSPIVRSKSTKTGWHYEPRFITFTTAKHNALNNLKPDGSTDYGDAAVKFWDVNGAELKRSDYGSDFLFQTALTLSCVKTAMDWQPTYDMDIRGGVFLNGVRPSGVSWGWAIVAPDIPENLGGSVPHITGGIPLHLLDNYGYIPFEGMTVKTVLADPIYNSNKFRTIIKHAAGSQIELAVCFQQYKG